MKMLPFEDFVKNFDNKIMRNKMILSTYKASWRCACGKDHFMIDESNVAFQGFWKLAVHCPENPAYITAVKVNTGFLGMKFKGYESLFGSEITSQEDKIVYHTIQASIS